MPALAPAILAVAAAFEYQRSAARLWLVVSGLLLGAALLVKPIVLRPWWRWRWRHCSGHGSA